MLFRSTEYVRGRYHLAHVSTHGSVQLIREAKARGLSVTCEVTPHHFALADCEMARYDSNYKMKPPLRAREDVGAMIHGVVAGVVDAIATDHAPHPGSEKMQEFEKCPFGILGLETAIGLTLDVFVHNGRISLMRMVELFTTGPARILGLRRGTLAAGAAGDVTIFDTKTEWTYDANKSYSKSRNTPFDGRTFHGGPLVTIVAGAVVWRR